MRGSWLGLAAAAGCLLGAPGPLRAADCSIELQRFNQAIEAGRAADAQAIVDDIATDAVCGSVQLQVQRRLAALNLKTAQELMARGRPSSEYDGLLADAARPGVLWQAAATVAELRFGERRFDDAARDFDAAIDLVRNETMTPVPPAASEIQQLVDRAAQSRLLEANHGSGHRPPSYVSASSDKRDGKLGGVFAPSVRGIVPHALPLPIVFDYDKATMNSVGEDAARELVRAVEEQRPGKIRLVGHTDIKGGAQYNLELSRQRAEAVADFMRRSGVDVSIEAVGVGSSQPMQVEDSAGLTQEDIDALNRRVDFDRQ